MHTDKVGTFSISSAIQSVPHRPWGMPSGIIILSQVVWTEVITKLSMLYAKVTHIEGIVRNWLDLRIEVLDR